ncbi:MAG: tetratricopeptide repeat protein [Desulfovibrionales bacterium]
MSTYTWIKRLFAEKRTASELDRGPFFSSFEGNLPPNRDTQSAIGELSAAVKNNPDAVEIYLALGNLFRSQGEIDRAIQIRNSLIVRQNLDPRFKARAWFEMGRDYKRAGFLDRAQSAFEQARALLGDDPALLEEMARLAADSGDFEKTAAFYGKLNNRRAEAHYLVRLARQSQTRGDKGGSKKWLNKAMRVFSGSPEAWLETLLQVYQSGDFEKFSRELKTALDQVDQNLSFVLLEGILEFPIRVKEEETSSQPEPGENVSESFPVEFCNYLLPVLEQQPQDLLIYYYGAWLSLRCGDSITAQNWFEKTLLLNSDFWPARLELLANSIEEQNLTQVFKVQLEFFLDRARRVKRFVCLKCGLKREQIFFVCPRCQAWHSISFRLSLGD